MTLKLLYRLNLPIRDEYSNIKINVFGIRVVKEKT